jgi:nicotinate-nucleotide pyrophosphorylase
LLQKDAKHQRITNQIALIQEELSNLTVVEVERREFRAFEEMVRNCLDVFFLDK